MTSMLPTVTQMAEVRPGWGISESRCSGRMVGVTSSEWGWTRPKWKNPPPLWCWRCSANWRRVKEEQPLQPWCRHRHVRSACAGPGGTRCGTPARTWCSGTACCGWSGDTAAPSHWWSSPHRTSSGTAWPGEGGSPSHAPWEQGRHWSYC